MRPVLVLFDVDGTLLLTGGAGSRALEQTFREHFGVARAFAGIRPHGRTDRRLLAHMARRQLGRRLRAQEEAAFWHDYLRHLERELARSPGFQVLPGVVALLETLRREPGVYLGLATGNLEEASWLKLRRAGLAGYFRFGGFGSDAPGRAALTRTALGRGRVLAGAPEAPAVLVGDTTADMRAARAAGALGVGVATTVASPAQLLAAGACLVLPDLRASPPLLALVSRLREG